MTTARPYLRVSEDRRGDQRSPDEQLEDHEGAAAEHGWSLGAPYRDTDRSASKYSRKRREDFEQLVADLEADQFGADVLMLWESSRGSRRAGEWVTLLDLCEDRHVRIWVGTHERLYDPSNARDRKSLLNDAVDAEYSSAETSQRVRRSTRSSAKAGRPHGKVPYGYQRRYGPNPNGKGITLLEQVPLPGEAEHVEELFTRLDAGDAFNAIQRDWEARGIVRRDGKPFMASDLRSLATTAAFGGYRVFTPGRTTRNSKGLQSTLLDAAWEPLVDRPLFWRVQNRLKDPKRKTTRGGAAKHTLSLIATAGPCGGPLTALEVGGARKYRCSKCGCIKISADALDAHARDVAVAYLSRTDVQAALDLDGADPEVDKVRARIAAIEHELEELGGALRARRITVTVAGAAEEGWLSELSELREKLKGLEAPSPLSVVDPEAGLREWWDDETTPVGAKREVARMLFSPGLIGVLTVHRQEYTGQPVAERVTWERAA